MSRLLHAAARGARIEKPHRDHWVETKFVLTTIGDWQRIHPDDAHLQYGPISTALREIALTENSDGVNIPYIEVSLLKEDGYLGSTADQRRVFCLILAEALADEGV